MRRTVLYKDCELSYWVRGTGAPVLFIQGVGVHGGGWSPQVEALSSEFRCLSFDNRGMGASQPLTLPLTVERPAPVAPDEDRFVPPPPPPLPLVPRDRMIAWVCLFGSPTILLITLVTGITIQPWLGYLLVAGFVGGFGYLVVKMPHSREDPWDDGARL